MIKPYLLANRNHYAPAVWLALISIALKRGKLKFRTNGQELEEYTGITRRATISAAMTTLTKAKWIKRKIRKKQGDNGQFYTTVLVQLIEPKLVFSLWDRHRVANNRVATESQIRENNEISPMNNRVATSPSSIITESQITQENDTSLLQRESSENSRSLSEEQNSLSKRRVPKALEEKISPHETEFN